MFGSDYLKPEKNYFIIYNNKRERKFNEKWFAEKDRQAERLIEAASVMLGPTSKEDLRELFRELYCS